MQRIICALLLISLAACSNAAIDKAAGDGAGEGIAVRRSATAVVVENNTGRPLLAVRATIETDTGATFVQVLHALDTGQDADLAFANFRSEDGTLFELSMSQPARINVTARDTLAGTYEAGIDW
ncbi:MAG: hypothetical protein Q8O42_12260 [Acidobacteriota bacterium]|nr:hypothetical protein [Acidobacteriota bacterium]